MKRICILMSVVFMAVSLCSCSNLAGSVDVNTTRPNTISNPAEAPENKESASSRNEYSLIEEEIAVPPEDSYSMLEHLSNLVLLDDQGVRITTKGFESTEDYGAILHLTVKNMTDHNITVQSRDCSVNGYMVSDIMSVNVPAGEDVSDDLRIYTSELERNGITEVFDIEFRFHVFDTESWDTLFDSEKMVLRSESASTHHYEFDDAGQVVYDANDIKIVIKDLSLEGSYIGPELKYYVYNGTDRALTFQVRDFTVNGSDVATVCSSDVAAGKHILDTVSISQSSLDEQGISDIHDVRFFFIMFDSEEYDGVELETEYIQLQY